MHNPDEAISEGESFRIATARFYRPDALSETQPTVMKH